MVFSQTDVSGNGRVTVQTSNICADIGRQNANASQNKKRSNATQKADPKLLHILFCPTHPKPIHQTTLRLFENY